MPWGLILEDARICVPFAKLSHQQQVVVAAAYLYRQFALIEAFDRRYNEHASVLFTQALEGALAHDPEALGLIHLQIEQQIPDTEVFSEQEGSYAQNLLIALSYFLHFVQCRALEKLTQSIALLLENIDLINYEVDEAYDEHAVFSQEVSVFLGLINAVQEIAVDQYSDFSRAQTLASRYRLLAA